MRTLRMGVGLTRTIGGAALLATVSASAQAQGAALPPAKDVIAKFVSATNASVVLAKHSSVRTKGRFEMAAQGVSGDLEISQARPNKSVLKINIAGLGQIEKGYDGTTGWDVNPMQGPRILSGKELDVVREESTFGA